jgi:hypothetical protein
MSPGDVLHGEASVPADAPPGRYRIVKRMSADPEAQAAGEGDLTVRAELEVVAPR